MRNSKNFDVQFTTNGGSSLIKKDIFNDTPGASNVQKAKSELFEFSDDENQSQNLSDFDKLLVFHANLTLLKIICAFKKTNVIFISQTKSLINNLKSLSKDQLNQKTGLDMSKDEK